MIFLNHGVYDIPKPALLGLNAYLAAFQCWEYTSGAVATPASPIPPARASGAIFNDGIAVCIGFTSSCAYAPNASNAKIFTNKIFLKRLFIYSTI